MVSSCQRLGFENNKKSARFNEAQKKYLEDKFNLGQEKGHNQDPERVARDMRFGKKADGSRLSQPMSFCPRNRYSHSFQEWHLSCVTLRR